MILLVDLGWVLDVRVLETASIDNILFASIDFRDIFECLIQMALTWLFFLFLRLIFLAFVYNYIWLVCFRFIDFRWFQFFIMMLTLLYNSRFIWYFTLYLTFVFIRCFTLYIASGFIWHFTLYLTFRFIQNFSLYFSSTSMSHLNWLINFLRLKRLDRLIDFLRVSLLYRLINFWRLSSIWY